MELYALELKLEAQRKLQKRRGLQEHKVLHSSLFFNFMLLLSNLLSRTRDWVIDAKTTCLDVQVDTKTHGHAQNFKQNMTCICPCNLK